MSENLSAAALHDIAVTLENEVAFHDAYKASAPLMAEARTRRDLIQRYAKLVGYRTNATDREHLRRYFDDTYKIPKTTHATTLNPPVLEFWLDDVKYPPQLPPGVQEGTKFDISFCRAPDANNRAAWSRFGRLWGGDEIARLKGLFWSGRSLEYICHDMERPPSGVLNKLAEHDCLSYDPMTSAYTVRKKTPHNSGPTKDIEPEREVTTLPAEIAAHIDNAVSHLTRVSNSLKEILMNKTEIIKIETKTFVNGVDISTMEDSDVYALIATQEAQIKELDKIETKPRKLTAEIEKRKAGVKALVDYLDSKPE